MMVMNTRRTQSQNTELREKENIKHKENKLQTGHQFFRQYMKNAMKYRNKDMKFQLK